MSKKVSFERVLELFIKWLLSDMVMLKAITYGVVGGIIGVLLGYAIVGAILLSMIVGLILLSIIGGVIGYLSKKQIYFFKKKTPKVNNNGYYYPNYKVRQQCTASISPNFSTKAESQEPPPYFSTWSFVDDSDIAKQEYNKKIREDQNIYRGRGFFSINPSHRKRMQRLADIKEDILTKEELDKYVE